MKRLMRAAFVFLALIIPVGAQEILTAGMGNGRLWIGLSDEGKAAFVVGIRDALGDCQ